MQAKIKQKSEGVGQVGVDEIINAVDHQGGLCSQQNICQQSTMGEKKDGRSAMSPSSEPAYGAHQI